MTATTLLESQFVSALIGAGSATIIFLIGYAIQKYREDCQALNSQISTLQIALNEAKFYLERLQQLVGEAKAIIQVCDARLAGGHQPNQIIVPSYSIYPDVLGQTKLALAREIENADLVSLASLLHFELSHIAERLKSVKEYAAGGIPNGAISNFKSDVQGFLGLVELNIPRFAKCAKLLEGELAERKRRLSCLQLR